MRMMKGKLYLTTILKLIDKDSESISIEVAETGVVFLNGEPVCSLKIEYNDW